MIIRLENIQPGKKFLSKSRIEELMKNFEKLQEQTSSVKVQQIRVYSKFNYFVASGNHQLLAHYLLGQKELDLKVEGINSADLTNVIHVHDNGIRTWEHLGKRLVTEEYYAKNLKKSASPSSLSDLHPHFDGYQPLFA